MPKAPAATTKRLYRVLDAEPCLSLAQYVDDGGGIALHAAKSLDEMAILDTIADSGLRGRGGAGFPTAKKWLAVAEHNSTTVPTSVMVNAAEGEPSTFKDRFILRNNPYRVLEGALIACQVVGADRLSVCLKGSFAEEIERVTRALAEIEAAGWAANIVLNIVRGPDSYLFGEETGLLEVASNRQPFPRITPPWRRGLDETNPTSSGAVIASLDGDDGAPALVNNVETFANVALIVRHGAEWFREIGTDDSPGSIVCTVTGDVRTHGVGEFALGTPLSEIIEELGGGAREGRRIVAVLPGASSAIVGEYDLPTPCTHQAFAAIGSGLGSAGFLCLDDSADLLRIAAAASRFLAVESCGQCSACKTDGIAIAELLAAPLTKAQNREAGTDASGSVPGSDAESSKSIPSGEMRDVSEEMTDTVAAKIDSRLATVTNGARCSLASQQFAVVGSLLLQPRPTHLPRDPDRADEQSRYLTPLLDIVDGSAVYDVRHLTKNYDWTYDTRDSGKTPAQRLQGIPIQPETTADDPM